MNGKWIKIGLFGLLFLSLAAVSTSRTRGANPAPAPNPPKKDPTQLWKSEPDRTGPVAFTPDGKALVMAGGRHVFQWEPATGKEIRHDVHKTKWVWDAHALSADSKVAALLEARDKLHVLDTATGKERCLLDNSPDLYGKSHTMALSPDGSLLVANYIGDIGDHPGQHLRFWDAATGKEQKELEVERAKTVRCLAVSADNKTLAFGVDPTTVELYQLDGRKPLGSFTVPRDKNADRLPGRAPRSRLVAILSVGFSPDGKTLAVGDNDGNVHLFEVKTGKHLRLLGSGPKPLTDFSVPCIKDVSFSNDGKTLVAADGFLAGGGEGRVRLWDVTTGKELGSVPLPIKGNIKWTWAALSPDGKYLAVSARSDEASAVAVWDVAGLISR
jgi:WD40 repeat protein